MTRKKKLIIAIIVSIVLVLAVLIFLNLPKPVTSTDASFDLTETANGTYTGNCDNGLVKVLVDVTVKDHTIIQIDLLKHDNGLGGNAEVITDTVVQNQSVEVDTVSGATMSSKTILKAIENALSDKEKKT